MKGQRFLVKILFSCIVLIFIHFRATGGHSDKWLADSIIQRLPSMPDDSNKSYAYRDISYYLLFQSPDSALIFSTKGYQLAWSLGFIPGQIWNLNQLGFAYELKEEFDSALRYYREALTLASKSGDISAEAKMYNVIGSVHYHQGHFSEAINHYNRSLELFKQSHDLGGRAQVLNNLGIIYRIRRNYIRAIDIYKESLMIKEQHNDTIGKANTLRNLGLLYAHLDSAELSMQLLLQAIEIHQQYNHQAYISECEIGIGSALFTLEKWDEAQAVFEKAVPNLSKSSTLEYNTALLLTGAIDVRKGRAIQGISTMTGAYEVIKSSGRLDLLRTAEKELAMAYENVGDLSLASGHWKNYALLSDSLASEQKEWAAEEMMARFESREKENMIQMQALALAEINARKKLYFLSGLLFVLLFVGATVFGYNRVKLNRKLQKANDRTQALLRDKELLLKEMHHRVKNNLQMLSSLLSLQIREIKDPATLGMVKSNRSRLDSISFIHQLLYIREDFRQIDMQHFVEMITNHYRNLYDLSKHNVTITTDVGHVLLDIDVAIPLGLIINELVINSIKHAFPNGQQGEIDIYLHWENENIVLRVSDNGVGFSQQKRTNDSFGHKLIKTLTLRMEANLQISGERGTHTRCIFNPKY